MATTLILECFTSLLAADLSNLHIVLVDNGSSDQIPAGATEDFSGMLAILETNINLGVPVAYNVGFAHALQIGSNYIPMLNSDTVISPK